MANETHKIIIHSCYLLHFIELNPGANEVNCVFKDPSYLQKEKWASRMGWSCWKVNDPFTSSGNSTQKASKSQGLQLMTGNSAASLLGLTSRFPVLTVVDYT